MWWWIHGRSTKSCLLHARIHVGHWCSDYIYPALIICCLFCVRLLYRATGQTVVANVTKFDSRGNPVLRFILAPKVRSQGHAVSEVLRNAYSVIARYWHSLDGVSVCRWPLVWFLFDFSSINSLTYLLTYCVRTCKWQTLTACLVVTSAKWVMFSSTLVCLLEVLRKHHSTDARRCSVCRTLNSFPAKYFFWNLCTTVELLPHVVRS